MDLNRQKRDPCPTLRLASVSAKFQIALHPSNAEKVLLVGKGLGEEPRWVILTLLAGDGSTRPSVDALPVLPFYPQACTWYPSENRSH